jgi:hypothetical protein
LRSEETVQMKQIALCARRPESVEADAQVGVVLPELSAPTPPPYEAVVWQWRDTPLSGALTVEEHVLRGADWLADQRAAAPYRHLALARRADGLTRAEFRQRWREHSGSVGTAVGTTEIPPTAQGLAYLQNHAMGDDPAYDAINEVFFADLESLRQRVAWFVANPPLPGELFGPTTFLAVQMRHR